MEWNVINILNIYFYIKFYIIFSFVKIKKKEI